MHAIVISNKKQDAKIDIFFDENAKSKNFKNLDDITFLHNQLISKLKSLNETDGYAICIDSKDGYDLGIKKISDIAVEFLNDNYHDWDIINMSSIGNEIWSAQRPLKTSRKSSWALSEDYMTNNFVKKIYTFPRYPSGRKYYMNTYCSMYLINLKNIKKIYDILCPIRMNGILINFLENLNKLNLYFLNSNINKFESYNNPGSADVNLAYDPTIFFDWYGGDLKNKIFYDNIFILKIHKSLVNPLTDEEILNRFVVKIDKKIVDLDEVKIRWATDDSNYNIENNLIEIVFSVKTSLQKILHSKYWNKEILLEAVYLCPHTGNKIIKEKNLFLKKIDKKT
jgi:hypothetical protein